MTPAADPGTLAPELEELRFAADTFLRRSVDRSLPKRERTRFLLMHGVLQELGGRHASELTVDRILDRVGLSKATFYRYYPSAGALLASFLDVFFATVWAWRPRTRLPPRDAISAANLFFCRAFAANADIFAAIDTYAAANADIHRGRQKVNAELTHAVVKVLRRRGAAPADEGAPDRLAGVVRTLIAMTDETVRERFGRLDATLVQAFPTPDALAEGISLVWVRALGLDEDGTG